MNWLQEIETTGFGRALLVFFGTYEAFSAVALLGPVAWTVALARRAYRLELSGELDPKYVYANRMVGLHCGLLALLCALGASSDGSAPVLILVGVAAISGARALARWGYRDLLFRAFGVAPERSLRKALFNLALLAIVVLVSFKRQS